MSAELTFYTHPMSRGRMVRWMLEEVGMPYRTELVEYGPAMKAPAYLAVNPMGKVPALRHGDVVVTEVAAICSYLADVFPQAGLAPAADDPQRGAYYRWMFFGAGPLEAAVTNQALGFVVPEGRDRMAGYGRLATVTDVLEAALSKQDYLVGGRFTAADLYVGSQIGWSMMFKTIEKRPAFEAYWTRIAGRPAAQRAKQIDDALIPERE